jgi:6-phosphogluconolactonase (cycloisomerase 2 family)
VCGAAVPGATATGKLTFQQVLKNARGGVSGLDGASGVAVSADGKNVYALGYDSNGIVAFTRDTTTGELTFQQAIVNGVGGLSGLEGPISITVSPDGKSVYAAGTVSDMLLAFDRGAATGQLTLRQTFTDGVAGADGLFGAVSVAVSPDNKYVYAAAKDEDALSLFSRNLTTGQLSFVRVVRDHTGGIDGLDQVFSLAVSPDGKALYAVADADNAVTVFARNAATGELTFLQKFKERVDSVQGLDGAEGVAVNPDGAFVYTAATRDNAVAVFKRDATTSLLIFRQVLANGDGAPIAALNSANGVAVSPDGANVYAVGSGQHPFTPGAGVPGLAVFTRDPSTGRLLFQEAIINNTGGVDGLGDAACVTVSTDGQNVYAGGTGLAVFARDADTGLLVFQQALKDGVGGITRFAGVSDVVVSPDGLHVYTTGTGLGVFDRNLDTGLLALEQMLPDTFWGYGALTVSSDGQHVYVTGSSGAPMSVLVYQRVEWRVSPARRRLLLLPTVTMFMP